MVRVSIGCIRDVKVDCVVIIAVSLVSCQGRIQNTGIQYRIVTH
jgi:hypothetical protein